MTGSIELTCAQRDGRSYLSRIRYDGLSRVSRPQRAGDAAHVVLSHLGPGVIGGDHYTLDGRVEAGASLLVTGQMATPVYARSSPSSVTTRWKIGAGALLVACNEPVMLNPDAQHDAHTTIDVEGDGCVILADIFTVAPRALAAVRTAARINGRLALRDACNLHGISHAVATLSVVCSDLYRRNTFFDALARAIAEADTWNAGLGYINGVVIARARAEQVWPMRRLINALVTSASALEAGAGRRPTREAVSDGRALPLSA